ncbi:MAG: isoprenylcysteine carboxylmethyltransferase family protein [Gemmatimonadota bacterium]|jgi:protein-S-isoprenylcysteine O-methyltransferase Ste14
METTRRILAILLIVGMPPAVAFWLVAHPLAALWRRLGSLWTYIALAVAWIALAAILFLLRGSLIGRDLGTSWPLIAVGVVLYGASAWLSLLCRRQLRLNIFAGLPELSSRAYPGHLLQEGVYGVIRHPRYASVILGTVGFALAVNYTGAYVVEAVSLLLLWPVVVLEERELAARFGPEYEAYRRRTPALLPRWKFT